MGTDNPVTRLKLIFDELRNAKASESIGLVLTRVLLGGTKIEPREVYRAGADLLHLMEDSKAVVQELALDPALFLAPIEHVEKPFRQGVSINGPWSNVMGALETGQLDRLAYCADAVSRMLSDGDYGGIEPASLEDIQRMILELTEAVRDSKLEERLCTILLERLSEMDVAVSCYRLRGVRGLRIASNQLFAEVVRHRELLVEIKGTPLWKKFGELMSAVDSALNVAERTPYLLPWATYLLDRLLQSGD